MSCLELSYSCSLLPFLLYVKLYVLPPDIVKTMPLPDCFQEPAKRLPSCVMTADPSDESDIVSPYWGSFHVPASDEDVPDFDDELREAELEERELNDFELEELAEDFELLDELMLLDELDVEFVPMSFARAALVAPSMPSELFISLVYPHMIVPSQWNLSFAACAIQSPSSPPILHDPIA